MCVCRDGVCWGGVREGVCSSLPGYVSVYVCECALGQATAIQPARLPPPRLLGRAAPLSSGPRAGSKVGPDPFQTAPRPCPCSPSRPGGSVHQPLPKRGHGAGCRRPGRRIPPSPHSLARPPRHTQPGSRPAGRLHSCRKSRSPRRVRPPGPACQSRVWGAQSGGLGLDRSCSGAGGLESRVGPSLEPVCLGAALQGGAGWFWFVGALLLQPCSMPTSACVCVPACPYPAGGHGVVLCRALGRVPANSIPLCAFCRVPSPKVDRQAGPELLAAGATCAGQGLALGA